NPRIDCIALAQGGDMIGGVYDKKYIKRKIMNVFFCATDRDFKFYGTMNDDVSTYTLLGARGKLFLQIPYLILEQCITQSQKGGLTDMYLEFGTYNKSMATKILLPSACIVEYSKKVGRIHHRINYNRMPKLISGNYKKL
ncbi:MAG TPA: hypothetical protein DEQ48_06020, partial [Helicobacter sp.]|nr:hypothetical protein [Helicobacter sp.]